MEAALKEWDLDEVLSRKILIKLKATSEYIVGVIMDGDEWNDDKQEAVSETLSGFLEDDSEQDIVKKVNALREMFDVHCKQVSALREQERDNDLELAKSMQMNSLTPDKNLESKTNDRPLSAKECEALKEAQQIKARLLAQFAYDDDDYENEEDPGDNADIGGSQSIAPNVNAQIVMEKERQKRMQHKAEHEHRVERDKKAREVQLQKLNEKKTTQKKEKRRM